MFELEDLFELTKEGAFASKEEFISFASGLKNDELFSVLKDGAFSSPEEMSSLLKKKEDPSGVTSPMEPMGSTLPQEGTSGLSESEELVETEFDVADQFEGMPLFKEDKESEIAKKLEANTRRVGSSLSRIPVFLAEQVFTLTASEEQKDFVNSLPADQRETFLAQLVSSTTRSGDFAPVLTKFSQEQGEKIKEIEDTYQQYETSIGQDFANLDLGQAMDRTFTEIVGGAPQLVQAMIPVVGLASIAVGSAAAKSGELQRDGEDLGLRTSLNSIVSGTAEGVFEIVTRKLGKKLLDSFKVNPEETIQTFGQKIKEILVDSNLEGASELATTITQSASDALIQGKDVDVMDVIREAIDAYIIGGGTGGSLTGFGKAYTTTKQAAEKNRLSKKIKGTKYNSIEDVFAPITTPDGDLGSQTDIDQTTLDIASSNVSRKFVVEGLNRSVKRGDLTREQADSRLNDFDKIRAADKRVGEEVSGENRLKAVDLVREKQTINQEIAGVEPVLVEGKKQRLEEIDNELKEIANAVQEQETREVPDAEQAEGVQEVEGEVRESDVETEESVTSADPTLDIPVKEEEKIDIAESIGNSRKVKPNNVKGLLDVMGGVFGLNKKQAKSAAVVGDVMVETMAKRAGVSKDEMYQRIAFAKSTKEAIDKLPTKGKKLFQIVGENAQLGETIKENLQVARDMEASGNDAKTIRIATGWEKGKDGEWRYEVEDNINDVIYDFIETEYGDFEKTQRAERNLFELRSNKNKVFTKEEGDAISQKRLDLQRDVEQGRKTKQTAQKEYSEFLNEFNAEQRVKDNIKKISEAEREYERISKLPVKIDGVEKRLFLLKDVVPSIAKMYPTLANTSLEIKVDDNYKGLGKGFFEKSLGISVTLPKNVTKTNAGEILLHEIQHAIQEIEGFAKGGSPENVLNEIQKELDRVKDKSSDAERFMELDRQLFGDDSKRTQESRAKYNKLAEQYNALLNASTKAEEKVAFGDLTSNNLYKRLAGEVEARNVQTRMGMTPEQRRATTLQETEDVARDEQIVLFQGARGAMVSEDVNAIIFALTNPNVSTPLHELAHVYENYLTDQERKTIQDWAGTDTWTTETSEKFARGFERFLAGGEVKNQKLKQAFNNFKKWLTEIYNGIVGSDIDIELNDTMNGIYNTMLGSDKKSIPLSEETLEGYDKMMNRIDDIINRMSKKPDMTKAKILDSVTKNLQSRDLAYRRATDVQREQIIRDLRSRLGVKEKAAPSARKVTGQPKRKKVTVDEYASLKDQIKLEAKAARESVTAYKNAGKKIAEAVKALGGKGKLTVRQANTVANKILRTNLTNDKQVKGLLEYLEKIYQRAELSDMIVNARKRKKRAKANLKSKVGPDGVLLGKLRDMVSLDPTDIPLDLLPEYADFMDRLGASSKVLDLPQKRDALDLATRILERVGDSFDNTLTETSSPKDYNLDEAVKEIQSEKIDVSNISNPDAKKLAEFINGLTKKDIEGLVTESKDGKKDYSKVENLKSLKREMNKGYAPSFAFEVKTKVESNRVVDNLSGRPLANTNIGTNVLNFLDRKVYGTIKGLLRGTKAIEEVLRATAFVGTSLDNALGNYNRSDFRRQVVDRIATAYESLTNDFRSIREDYLERAEYVLSRNGIEMRDNNSILKSKYKIQTFLLQLEFLSNMKLDKDGVNTNTQVAPAIGFINKTIDKMKSEEGVLKDGRIKILEEIRDEFSENGEISIEKIEQSLSDGEKEATYLIQQAYSQTNEKYQYLASVVRGEGVKPLNNYVHHNVMYDKARDEKDAMSDKSKKFVSASTKSGTVLQRTPSAKAINFDPISSASKGINEMLTDYHMTEPVKVALSITNKLKSIEGLSKNQQNAMNALDNVLKESLDKVFMNTMTSNTVFDKFLQAVDKYGYYAALASVPRAGAELGSNFVGALTMSPKTFTTGIANFGNFSMGQNVEGFLRAVQSSSINKLAPESGSLGKFGDGTTFSKGERASSAMNPVLNKVDWLAKNARTPQLRKLLDAVPEKLLMTPDLAISRPVFFQSFADKFQELTGKKLTVEDYIAIANGDMSSIEGNMDAVADARDFADTQVKRLAASANPFEKPLKNIIGVDDSGIKKVYKRANSYMANFFAFEFNTASEAVVAIFNSGEISRRQAFGLLGMVGARMSTYLVTYKVLSSLFDNAISELFGIDIGEEEEEDLLGMSIRQSIGSAATLMLRRRMGSLSSLPAMYGLEYVNEEYLQELRDGEDYDSYKHGLAFTPIPRDELSKMNPAEALFMTLSGPQGPMLKSGLRAAKLMQRGSEEAMDELEDRMILEGAGNVNLIPFYKDIRRILLKNQFKDYGKESLWKDVEREKKEYEKREEKRNIEQNKFIKSFNKGFENDGFKGGGFKGGGF
jgi:hypothetical protein